MKKTVFYVLFFTFFFNIEGNSAEKNPNINNYEDIFNVGQMSSHDKKFTLFFRTREKAVLAKGEGFNYIADYPQDLYILFNNSNKIKPLITYDWFPKTVKKLNPNLNLPVFPEDYAYYLLKDNKTLIMISAFKTIRSNFKFDLQNQTLERLPIKHKYKLYISSLLRDCGYKDIHSTFECSYYKPLISENLIN